MPQADAPNPPSPAKREAILTGSLGATGDQATGLGSPAREPPATNLAPLVDSPPSLVPKTTWHLAPVCPTGHSCRLLLAVLGLQLPPVG